MSIDKSNTIHETSDSLSLAVLSDLHAFDKNVYEEDHSPSFLDMSLSEGREKIHPISALKTLIKINSFAVDILICAGDMGDKAKPSAIQYTWTKLQELKSILGARIIAATPGNHDHDSRSAYCKYDPRGALQNLLPKFPLEPENCFNAFWSKNYSIINDNLFRLVILNSSAFHGICKEKEHGRISSYTLEALEKDLENCSAAPINILVCHHHPQKNEDVNLTDYDVMDGGQGLLRILGSGRSGNWIVIHGHKHCPKLSYGGEGTGGPAVFSAGSLCAFLPPEIHAIAKNQFYIIKFNLKTFKDYGFVGRFQSWDWANGKGWIPSACNSGLPSSGGFGFRTQLNLVADKVAEQTGTSRKKEWNEIIKNIPEIQYLMPGDLNILEQNLLNLHSLRVVKSAEGLILQIGKKK